MPLIPSLSASIPKDVSQPTTIDPFFDISYGLTIPFGYLSC
jgi:hypothetical protein